MIVGAGAIGGTVGTVLARARVPMVSVARGRHAEVLAAAGMTLRTPDGTFRTPVTIASAAELVRLTPRDVLVFAIKTQQLDAALQLIRPTRVRWWPPCAMRAKRCCGRPE